VDENYVGWLQVYILDNGKDGYDSEYECNGY